MEIIDKQITNKELAKEFLNYFKTIIKAVVDVEKEIIAIDAELHSDLETLLLGNGSKQENLWGINLCPFKNKNDFIEYTSLINIRPHQDNLSMEIENQEIKEKIKKIVDKLIEYEPQTT
jgi:spermidine/putrescine-binding protein